MLKFSPSATLIVCSLMMFAYAKSQTPDVELRISNTDFNYRYSKTAQVPNISPGRMNRIAGEELALDTYGPLPMANSKQFLLVQPLINDSPATFRQAKIKYVIFNPGSSPDRIDIDDNSISSGRTFLPISLSFLNDCKPGELIKVEIHFDPALKTNVKTYYFSCALPLSEEDQVKSEIKKSCSQCSDDNLIIYDQRCKQLYTFRNDVVEKVKSLSRIKVYYNQPLKFEILHVNRYINNIALEMDDISNVSTTPPLINTYLLGGGGSLTGVVQNISNQATKTPAITPPSPKGGAQPTSTPVGSTNENAQFVPQVVDKLTGDDNPKHLSLALKNTKLSTNQISDYFSTKMKNPSLLLGISKKGKPVKVKIINIDTAQRKLTIETPDTKTKKAIQQMKVITSKDVIKSTPKAPPAKNATADTSTASKPAAPYSAAAADSIRNRFLSGLFEFREKYDQLLDNEVLAYSACTDNLPCCGMEPGATLSDLDLLLFRLDTEYVSLKRVFVQSNPPTKPDSPSQGTPKPNPVTTNTTSTCCIICTSCPSSSSDPSKDKSSKDKSTDPNAELDSLWASFKKITQEQLMKLVLFHNNLVKDNLSFISAPIYPQGEGLNINLEISTQDSAAKYGIPVQDDQTHFNLIVLHKIGFSFSTGTFYTWGKNLTSTKYEYQQVPAVGSVVQTTSPYKLLSTGVSSTALGVSALANVAYKVCTVASLGGSLGVGATIESKPRIAYFFGPTAAIGNQQQFYFTFGIDEIPVNSLQGNPSSNIYYSSNPGNVQYNSKLQMGWFFSLTYTIFKTKSSKYGSYTATPKASAPAGKGSNSLPSVSFQFNTANGGSSGNSDPSTSGSKKK
jgi:hypothetical protein